MDSISRSLLQSVSRSFALCIPMLEENKIRETENMYLLSRVVDTIEDSSLDKKEKKRLMSQFFLTLENRKEIGSFVSELKKGIIDEHDMVLAEEENYSAILDVFQSLDERVKSISISLLKEMSFGMEKYLEKEIRNFDDLNEYCYYVAGTVAIYMNNLVAIKDGVLLDKDNAISLGRYLQKVNIIKNFYKDKMEKRSFWPSDIMKENDEMHALEKMIKSAVSETDNAFSYAKSVPYKLNGYRRAILLVAFMATANINLMRNNKKIFTNKDEVKIPREVMPLIIKMCEMAANDNELIDFYRKRLEDLDFFTGKNYFESKIYEENKKL